MIWNKVARIVNDQSAATKLLVNPRTAKKTTPSDLLELALEVQRADEEVKHVASGKLQIIAEQIRFLQEQAKKILEEAKESTDLNKAKCNFVKKTGTIYYLYKRSSGITYFSMLSVQEWSNCPHEFLGAYRYEHDRSWTKLEDIAKKDEDMKVINRLLEKNCVPSIEYFSAEQN